MSAGDWVLAIDFGTTNTVAAATDVRGTNTLMVDGKQVTPSAVFLNPDRKSWSVGDTAIRIAKRRLEWFEPNPKRGVPDSMLFLGGQNVPVGEAITAVLRPIVDEASRQHGGRRPAAFVVTHPANWGEARVHILVEAAREAAAAAGKAWPDPQPLSEPVAAAQAILGMEDIPQQARLVVLDLGGGTVDATVVDRDGDVLTVIGQPQGRDGIGGEDYDQRLARWMVAEVGAEGLYDRLATSGDPEERELAVEIRSDARNIKEQLSRQTAVPAQLPKAPPELPEITPVMVSRSQLENLISGGPGHEPGLIESVEVVSSVLDPVPPGPPFIGVFLTGGCSRIPMLGTLVQERTGRSPLTFGDPTTAVAQGASQFGWKKTQEPATPPPTPPLAPPGGRGSGPGSTVPIPPIPSEPLPPRPERPGQLRRLVLLAVALFVVGGGIAGIALAAGPHHTTPIASPTVSTTPPTTPSTNPPSTNPPSTVPPSSPPPSISSANATGATAYSCGSEGTMHSTGGENSEGEVSFSFINDSPVTVQIDWLSYTGARQEFDTLQPGDTYNVNTYIGNVWVIANSSAACEFIYYINDGGNVTIN